MDAKDLELYNEENRQLLIEIKQGIGSLEQSLRKAIENIPKPHKAVEVTGKVDVNTQKDVAVTNFEVVADALNSISEQITKAIENNAHKPLEAVKVTNLKDAKLETLKISNFNELESYFSKLYAQIADNIQPVINLEKQEVVFPRLAKDAIPVRLSDGKKFYEAVSYAVGSTISTAGLATTEKQDDIITAIQASGEDVPTTQLAGDKDVAATGTPEAMATSTSCVYALIQAKTGNTSNCFVGNATSQEVELEPGQAWAFAIDNLSKIYIKVGTNGDGVNYTAG